MTFGEINLFALIPRVTHKHYEQSCLYATHEPAQTNVTQHED